MQVTQTALGWCAKRLYNKYKDNPGERNEGATIENASRVQTMCEVRLYVWLDGVHWDQDRNGPAVLALGMRYQCLLRHVMLTAIGVC